MVDLELVLQNLEKRETDSNEIVDHRKALFYKGCVLRGKREVLTKLC